MLHITQDKRDDIGENNQIDSITTDSLLTLFALTCKNGKEPRTAELAKAQ